MEVISQHKVLDSLVEKLEKDNNILNTVYSKLFDFCRDRVAIIGKEYVKEIDDENFYIDERGGVFTNIANLLSSNFALIIRLEQLVEKLDKGI